MGAGLSILEQFIHGIQVAEILSANLLFNLISTEKIQIQMDRTVLMSY